MTSIDLGFLINKIKQTKQLNMKLLNNFKIFNDNLNLKSVVNLFKGYSNKSINKLPIIIKGKNLLQLKINKNLMTKEEIKILSQITIFI